MRAVRYRLAELLLAAALLTAVSCSEGHESERLRALSESPVLSLQPPGGRVEQTWTQLRCVDEASNQEPSIEQVIVFDSSPSTVRDFYISEFQALGWTLEDSAAEELVFHREADEGRDGAIVTIGDGRGTVLLRTDERLCS